MRYLFSVAFWLACNTFLAGCAVTPRKPVLRASDYSGTVRVACVGDSITYGAGVESREHNNYPTVLGKLLGPRFEVRNFGVSGATLLKKGDKPWWDEPAFKQLEGFAPQAIVLMLGTNDSKPRNWRHGDEFAADLDAMILHFSALPSRPKIWVCLPPPAYATKWGINEETVGGRIVPVIRQVTAGKNIPVIDMHREMSDRPEYFPDQIHPNAAGAAMMAMTVFTALKGR